MVVDLRILFTFFLATGSVATAHAIAPGSLVSDQTTTGTSSLQTASVEPSSELKAKFRRPNFDPVS